MLGAVYQIGEPCQSPFNAGFLTHLYLIRTDSVVYVQPPTADSISQPQTAIGIQPGAVITRFLIRPKTATLTESSSESTDGIAYTTSINFPVRGTVPELTTWLHQNNKGRFVILTRDTLGNCYLAGEPANGMRIIWSRQVAQQSLHSLTLQYPNWHPIQFIPTVDLDLLFPNREFDYSFDLSFS